MSLLASRQVRYVLFSLFLSPILFGFSSAQASSVASVSVTDNIHMITGKGGNIGVFIGEDGTFIIDDKYAPTTKDVLAEITKLGGEHPRFVINTHYHGDHTGGNEQLGEGGSIIVSHENVRTRLETEQVLKAFDFVMKPTKKPGLPIITFTKDIDFHLNGDRIHVFHLPAAHTDGDSAVWFEQANVLHTGDLLFNGIFPFIDVDHGGSVKGMIAAIDVLLSQINAETQIIPGHGPLAKKPELIAFKEMLVTTQQRLEKLKAEGKSAKQAAAENPLADLEEQWGKGMFTSQRWIEIIYAGI